MPGKISFMRRILGSMRIGYGVNYKKSKVILEKVIKKCPLFFFCNSNSDYRVYKNLPLVPILNHSNPVHVPKPISCRSILIISYLRLGFPCGLFSSCFLLREIV